MSFTIIIYYFLAYLNPTCYLSGNIRKEGDEQLQKQQLVVVPVTLKES